MPEAFAPAVGHRFAGRFELQELLRGSGPARVFMAADGAARPLVLVLFDPSACSPSAWAAFLRVVHAAAEAGLGALRNVPTTPPDPPFCLAESPVGWSFDRLRQGGPAWWLKQTTPRWDRALRLGERAAALLERAHAALGVPHRALTPQRLVVTENDELTILDFGVGELEPVAGRADDCGYRAPEQAKCAGDARSDVFSLASVVFELIAGERPSPRSPSRLRSLVPGVPQAVDELFAEALATEPWQRYADMAELRAAMREVLGLGPAPAVSVAPEARPEPPASVSAEHDPEAVLTRSDLPILPGSPDAPGPASVVPPVRERWIAPTSPGGVASPPVSSIVSAPPGGVAPPTSSSLASSIVSAPPGGVALAAAPSPASSFASPPRGSLLAPLGLPSSPVPTRPADSAPPRGSLLPPIQPRAVTPASSPASGEAPVSKTEIDWTRPRPDSSSSASSGSLRYSKLVGAEKTDILAVPEDPIRPPAAKTELLPPAPAQAAFTPVKTEMLPPSPASPVGARTEVLSSLPASTVGARTEIFTSPPTSTVGARTEILSSPPASLAGARTQILSSPPASTVGARTEMFTSSSVSPAAPRTEIFTSSPARPLSPEERPAERTEAFHADEPAPANRAARTEIFFGQGATTSTERTEIFVGDPASGRTGRTELFVGNHATPAARSERTEQLSPGPNFTEPPRTPANLEHAPESAATGPAQPRPTSEVARPTTRGASLPAKASGPPVKLLLITVNAVLIVVIVLVLVLR